jgi:dihydroorotase-like cyclic amidohydrolase
MGSLAVINGLVVSTAGVVSATVLAEGGRIAALLPPRERPSADEVIDAGGRPVLPGLIDPHVHLGLSQPFADACWHESRAAVTGGVTAMVHYLLSPDSFCSTYQEHAGAIESRSLIDIGFHGMVQNDVQVAEIPETVRELGLTSYKFHMAMKGPEAAYGIRGVDDGLMFEGLRQVAAQPGVIALAHTENIDVILRFRDRWIERWRKEPESASWSDSRPVFTEEEAIVRAAFLAESAGAPLGVVHNSVGRGPALLAQAKVRYPHLYMETCPQYLTLTSEMGLGTRGKVNPPLRTAEHVELLWQALAAGQIDWLGSDHCDYDLASRNGDLWEVGPGLTSGVTMILPVLLRGVHQGRITLEQLVALTSANTARIFGFAPAKGSISVGSDADLVVVDLDTEVTVTPEVVHSFSDYTPYEGMSFRGWARTTVAGGEIVYDRGEVNDAAAHRGRVLKQNSCSKARL